MTTPRSRTGWNTCSGRTRPRFGADGAGLKYGKLLAESLRKDGVAATARAAWAHARRRWVMYLDIGFDLQNGVDTCAPKSIHDLDVDPEQKADLIGYEATPVSVLRRLLQALPIDHHRYALVDYGSGKGRVLLLASEYPFRSIVGVELSQSLHETAVKNIDQWRRKPRAGQDIRSLHLDATQYELPNEPLVLFFFTPFLEPVLRRIVARIQSHLSTTGQDLWILYLGSRDELLDEFKSLGLAHREIHPGGSWRLTGPYRGHLFYRASDA